MRDGGRTAGPSMTTRCSPTSRVGKSRARRTASAAAGAATIRLAASRAPARWARSPASLTDEVRPKSSAVKVMHRIGVRMSTASSPSPGPQSAALCLRGGVPLPQELEELHAFTQATLHHLRAADHLTHDRCDLRRAEVEALVEGLDVVEDFGVRQMWIRERRDLDAVVVHQFGMRLIQPAV